MPKGAHLGFPDIFVLMKTGKLDEEGNPISRVIFLEVKSSIGPQKPDQRKVELMVNELGAEYYIVRTVDFVKRIIEDSDI